MQRHRPTLTTPVLWLGLIGLIITQHQAHGDHGIAPQLQQHACRGFVVLPNGFAVLSAMSAAHAPGHTHRSPGAAPSGGALAGTGHSQGGRVDPPAAAPPHLLGYTHGQGVALQEGMLCVSVPGAEALAWVAVGRQPVLSIKAESLKGMLAHNSRDNEALTLTISRDGALLEEAQVQLLVRMPHHDRKVPGGHGPANDPDVRDLTTQPLGQGRYAVPTVDFTMPGPWLFEVQVQEGATTHKAYFAADIGEE